MTETQWLSSDEPKLLLDVIKYRANARRLRLIACGFCRLNWQNLDLPSQRLIEVTEEFADGRASAQDVKAANRLAAQAWEQGFGPCDDRHIDELNASMQASNAAEEEPLIAALFTVDPGSGTFEAELKAKQSDLIRCIIGNPFRSVVADPGWTVWNGGMIPKIAKAIYNDRAFDRLPILADALEEASCTDAVILEHCRGPGPHVRGCWVVDLLLGKN